MPPAHPQTLFWSAAEWVLWHSLPFICFHVGSLHSCICASSFAQNFSSPHSNVLPEVRVVEGPLVEELGNEVEDAQGSDRSRCQHSPRPNALADGRLHPAGHSVLAGMAAMSLKSPLGSPTALQNASQSCEGTEKKPRMPSTVFTLACGHIAPRHSPTKGGFKSGRWLEPKWHQASHLQISTACPAEKSCVLFFYWNIFGHFIRRPVVSGILSHIPSGILSEMDSGIYSDIRSDSLSAMYSDLLSKFLSDFSFEVCADYMLTVWHLIWQCVWRGEEEDQAYKKTRDPPQIKRETLRVCFVSFMEAIIATLHLFIGARGATSATLWANSCMHTWFEESAVVALLRSASRCILWACARKLEDKCELQMRSDLEKQIRSQKRKAIEILTCTDIVQ